MSRRDRLEAHQQRRLEWAAKAKQRAASRFAAGSSLTADIPFGQPILVGHHSEGRHRRVLERADGHLRAGVEAAELATLHASRADGLSRQLETSIFSDDADALEALEAKVATLTAKRDGMKAANAYWRKHQSMVGYPGLSDAAAARLDAEIPTRYAWERQPYPAYALTNLGATIRQAIARRKEVATRQARTAAATAAGGVLIETGNGWCRVTFEDRPDRDILEALRAAGYRWGGGCWTGPAAQLPARLSEEVAP